MTQHLAQLTDGQRDCLRLVYRHMTSKDIARTLGVSPHTVDMRLRTAMKVFEVDTLNISPWALREGIVLRYIDALDGRGAEPIEAGQVATQI